MTGLAAGQNIDQVTEGNHVLLRDPVIVQAIPSRVLAHRQSEGWSGDSCQIEPEEFHGFIWNVRYIDPTVAAWT